MAFEKAKAHLEKYGLSDRIKVFDVSSATVELAAAALGCEGARICKSLSFKIDDDKSVLVLTSGDCKVDNAKFKAYFGKKATMLSFDEVEEKIGHAVGGVCPFGINDGVDVYLDESMKRFDMMLPAAGSSSSCVRLTIEELERSCPGAEWANICKLPEITE